MIGWIRVSETHPIHKIIDTVLSGKVYGSVAATEALDIYGEFAFAGGVDDADNGYGTKVGVTYSF